MTLSLGRLTMRSLFSPLPKSSSSIITISPFIRPKLQFYSSFSTPTLYEKFNIKANTNTLPDIPYVPVTKLDGRTVSVAKYVANGAPTGDLMTAYRRLEMVLRRNNIIKEVRLNRFYERPGLKKKRLRREKHRKIFKELVRRKLQLVMEMKSRGM